MVSDNRIYAVKKHVDQMNAASEKVVHYSYDGYWKDLGRADDYEQATQDLTSMRAEFLRE